MQYLSALLVLLHLAVPIESSCKHGKYEYTDPVTNEITCKICPDGQISGHSKKHTCQLIHDKLRNCTAGSYGFKTMGCISCPAGRMSPAGAVKVQECRKPVTDESVTNEAATQLLTTPEQQEPSSVRPSVHPTKHPTIPKIPTTTPPEVTTEPLNHTTTPKIPTKPLPKEPTSNITTKVTQPKIPATKKPVSAAPPTKAPTKKGSSVGLIVTLLFVFLIVVGSAGYIVWRKTSHRRQGGSLPLIEHNGFTNPTLIDDETPVSQGFGLRRYKRQDSNYVCADELKLESEYVEASQVRISSQYEVLQLKDDGNQGKAYGSKCSAVENTPESEYVLSDLKNTPTKEAEYVNTYSVGAEPKAQPESEYVVASPFHAGSQPTENDQESEYDVPRNLNNITTSREHPQYMNTVGSNPTKSTQPESEYVDVNPFHTGPQPTKPEYVNTGLGLSEPTCTNTDMEEESEYAYASQGQLRFLRNRPEPAKASPSSEQGSWGQGAMPEGSEYVEPTFQQSIYENEEGIYSQCRNDS